MRYVDAFRNPKVAAALAQEIARLGEQLAAADQTVAIMEVCGSHTMAIARYGIRGLLPESVDLVSGPGCPVCVTPPGYMDAAIELARRGCHICTFGDMLNVPGSVQSLSAARAEGAAVHICYSPTDAVELARTHPDTQVVFLAIGFETTLAPTAALLQQPALPENFSLLTAFKLVPPALRALRQDPDLGIDAFLCPAHVSAIIGSEAYTEFAGQGGVPCVVAGFEPLDILLGIRGILTQILEGRSEVENQYERVVKPEGNPRAQEIMATYLTPVDAVWRGIGTLPASGLELKPCYAERDARCRFGIEIGAGTEPAGCACGDVIKGKLAPAACPLFGSRCTPSSAVGPCMVSSEGSCAAAYTYGRGAAV